MRKLGLIVRNMRNEQIEKLKSELSPLYDKLIKDVENEQPAEKAFFCMQWGKNFPNADNDGLMFVGRATNGWQDHDYKASSFFGNSFELDGRPRRGRTYNIQHPAKICPLRGHLSTYTLHS